MNTSKWRGVCGVLVLAAAAAAGCSGDRPRTSAVDGARIQADVHAMLERWTDAFERRDLEKVRGVLRDGEGFVWLEDGEARYRSVQDIVTALASFPPAMTFSHEITAERVTPISEHAAWAEVSTKTTIVQGERVVSEFAGVVLVLAQQEDGVWRIAAGHTSTVKPRGR